MVAQNEQTPLLSERRNSVHESSDTLTGSISSGDEEALDDDKANQSVSRWRGVLIILSLGGLIFLQGENISILLGVMWR